MAKKKLHPFIDELEPGTPITIHSYQKNASVDLDSKIAELSAQDSLFLANLFHRISNTHYAVIEPIHEQDLLINFRAEGVINDVYYTLENKPFVWRSVNIVNLQLPQQGSVHVLVVKDRCYQYNRRQFYRVWLGVNGVLQSSDVTDTKIILKDISEGGIGFICNEDLELKKNSVGVVSFVTDQVSYSFKVAIVRIIKMEDGRYHYGTRLLAMNEVAAKIVYTKQQQAMWNRSMKK